MSDQSEVKQSRLAENFIVEFGKKRDELEARIEALGNSNDLQDKLRVFSKDIQKLSKSLHDSVPFLPSYSIKKRQDEIRQLEKLLKDKEDLLAPKRKFGFKSKLNKSSPLKETKVLIEDSSDKLGSKENGKVIAVDNAKLDSNFVTIENMDGRTVICTDDNLNGADVLVRNTVGATIQLRGCPSTLRINGLKDCTVACLPVLTSVFIDGCSNCKFYLSCQQLRTHSSDHLDIYIEVRARAIIEDCTSIRFGPYNYDRNLQPVEVIEKFDFVDDFNWLSNEPSPNWSILPEEEREQLRA